MPPQRSQHSEQHDAADNGNDSGYVHSVAGSVLPLGGPLPPPRLLSTRCAPPRTCPPRHLLPCSAGPAKCCRRPAEGRSGRSTTTVAGTTYPLPERAIAMPADVKEPWQYRRGEKESGGQSSMTARCQSQEQRPAGPSAPAGSATVRTGRVTVGCECPAERAEGNRRCLAGVASRLVRRSGRERGVAHPPGGSRACRLSPSAPSRVGGSVAQSG